MSKSERLSFPMKRVLRAIRDCREPGEHCRTQSDWGGLDGTMRALLRRGLINDKHNLTKAGRAVAEKL